jgi:hypothetical protein
VARGWWPQHIVAEAEDGLVIVDQHAARALVLERMHRASNGGQVARRALLIPDVVELTSQIATGWGGGSNLASWTGSNGSALPCSGARRTGAAQQSRYAGPVT